MREPLRTTKAECPSCYRDNVHKVARIDPEFGKHATAEPSTNELWACRDCRENFIKEPVRAGWPGHLVQ